MINQTNPEVISRFVTSYNKKIWVIYLVVGSLLPLAISIVLEKIKKVFQKKKLLEGGKECRS